MTLRETSPTCPWLLTPEEGLGQTRGGEVSRQEHFFAARVKDNHMSIPFSRAPHIEGANAPVHSAHAPNAALLIDFDNVTMGVRSDLSKELKTLLSSDVIKGKVTVQRAYADWRRYPQYIKPLSESSIDLIFAPAYGSSKKNATDIRMAIDGMELVFTRPEIGTYILLSGDSDFSSLVLKLKEYGKFVIGVGMQESSSDILVQNCDEYYSYTSLSGLRKTDGGTELPTDPWGLVERAVEQMGKRGDVMRSDRLKQVMLEIDATFDEKSFGFNKFSRFVSEASRRGLVEIRRMENGQYEIVPSKPGTGGPEGKPQSRSRDQKKSERAFPRREWPTAGAGTASAVQAAPAAQDGAALDAAYALLRKAAGELIRDSDSELARDSDVKRRMLALEHGFNEAELGFPKFSRFLRQADDQGVVRLGQREGGSFQVGLTDGGAQADKAPLAAADPRPVSDRGAGVDVGRLRLPTGRDSIVKYLSNSYGGVGQRTAETLVDALGDELFRVLQSDPSRVEELLPPARAESVLAGWTADFERRRERHAGEAEEPASVFVASPPPLGPDEEPTVIVSGERRGRRTRRGPEPGS